MIPMNSLYFTPFSYTDFYGHTSISPLPDTLIRSCLFQSTHANYIKEELQQLFENFPIGLESKYTELWLKKTWIKVFPTKNIKDIRGY